MTPPVEHVMVGLRHERLERVRADWEPGAAISATIEVQPATAETIAPAEIAPAPVSTPAQPSSSIVIPVTGVPSWTWTPRRVAADARIPTRPNRGARWTRQVVGRPEHRQRAPAR